MGIFSSIGHNRRISVLEEDFQKLKRDFSALELEWLDVYDKLKKALGRVVKSRAMIEAREEREEGVPAEPTTLSPRDVGAPHALLTPRQKEIQQLILRRKAGG